MALDVLQQEADDREGGEGDGQAAVPKTGAEALSELRKRHKQTLDLCSILIKDRNLQLEGRVICEVGRPLRRDHLDSIQALKSQEGALAFHASQAMMGWARALQELVRKHSDERVLRRLGIVPEHAMASAVQQHLEPDPEYHRNAGTFMRLTIELCSQRTWSMSKHSFTYPDAFAGLASKSPEIVAKCAEQTRSVWSAIFAAEQLCLERPTRTAKLKSLLADLAYHSWQINREVVGELQLARWDADDESVKYLLWGLFARPSNTKQLNEDIFNHLRFAESRHQKNKKMNRWTKYWETVNAPTLQEQKSSHVQTVKLSDRDWNCPLPWANAVERTNEGIFVASGHTPQEPIKITDVIGRNSIKLKPAGPQANWRSAAATALLQHGASDGWSNIHNAWCGAPVDVDYALTRARVPTQHLIIVMPRA